MIWNLEVTNAVLGLGCDYRLPNEAMYRYINTEAMVEQILQDLRRTLMEAAFTCAVELNPFDIVIDRFSDEILDATRFRCRWRPSTKEIIMWGGPADGQMLTVENPYQIIRIPVMPNISLAQMPATPEVLPEALNYEMAGWNEDKRHWVFRLMS